MGADRGPATAVTGPTRMVESDAFEARWVARPFLARGIRLTLVIAPSAITILIGFIASTYLPPDALGINQWAWLALLVIVAAVLLNVLHRLTRRLLPMATLYREASCSTARPPERSSELDRTSTRSSMRS